MPHRFARRPLVVIVGLLIAVTALLLPAEGVLGRAGAAPSTPGAVLSAQTLSPDLVLTRSSGGVHYTYATTGPHGAPATSLGTVYLPKGRAPAGGWPVVAYNHGTAGLSDSVISYTGWVGKGNTGDAYLSSWLDAGFAVVATEYIGIGTPGVHPYLNTRSEATAVIDGVRAAHSVVSGLSPVWVANGYSQGGHASIAAASMARTYAPELRLVGVAAGGVPAGVTDELALVTPSAPINPSPDLTVYLSYVLAGFRAANPSYPLDAYLTPRGKQILDKAEELNYFDLSKEVASTAPGQMVTKPLSEGTLLTEMNKHLGLPVADYGIPVMIYQQAADLVSPAPFSARFAADLRAKGTDVDYRVYTNPLGHAAWDEMLPEVIRYSKAAVAAAR